MLEISTGADSLIGHHILTQRAIAKAPIVRTETLSEAPLLDGKKLLVQCNCSKFPQTSGIFFDQGNDEGKEDEKSHGDG